MLVVVVEVEVVKVKEVFVRRFHFQQLAVAFSRVNDPMMNVLMDETDGDGVVYSLHDFYCNRCLNIKNYLHRYSTV